jgi:hypothetical protein
MQQGYLCEREAVMQRTAAKFRQQGPTCTLKGESVDDVMQLIEEANEKVDRRLKRLSAHGTLAQRADSELCDQPPAMLRRNSLPNSGFEQPPKLEQQL